MTVEVPLRNQKGETVATAVIDDEDVGLTSHRWYLLACGYAARTDGVGKAKKMLYLHRVIIAAPRGSIVDHFNRDRLDNRRANLRITNHSGNAQNRPAWASRDLPRNVYRRDSKYAVIMKAPGDTSSRCLGRFTTIEDADTAARAWRSQLLPMSTEAANDEDFRLGRAIAGLTEAGFTASAAFDVARHVLDHGTYERTLRGGNLLRVVASTSRP